MIPRILSVLVSILIIGSHCVVRAQDQDLMPGVTDEIVTAIQMQVNKTIGDKYKVVQVLNVDSTLGDGQDPRCPDVGPIENPYGTLTHCFVFNGTRMLHALSADSARGIVGIYKNGKIEWNSDGLLTVGEPGMTANDIWAIKDINADGKVEILTTWISLSSGTNPPAYLWIFSWDGRKGFIVNSRDKYKQSVLRSTSSEMFSLVMNKREGVWDIQASVGIYERGTIRTESRTYRWNGSEYGNRLNDKGCVNIK